MNILQNRILEISKKLHLSHLGSCLTAVDIIDEIYQRKKDNEKFILSCGHAGLALYVVIEKYEGVNAEDSFLQHGTHPNRCVKSKIDCSTGSLGQGLPIALGIAFADRTKNVYCLISDGECSEGTIWETANIMQKYNITNLRVYLNFNGFSAYDSISEQLIKKIQFIMPSVEVRRTNVEDYGLKGLSAHYVIL